MMKTLAIKIITSVFIFAGFASASLLSQHLPDSLAAYIEIAAKNNPMVQQRLFEYQAALKKVPQAGSLQDPELSAGVFLKPMELLNGNQIADLRLMQMFPWFGVLKNAKDEMSLMAKAKYELFLETRAQLYFDVQKTWYELFRVYEQQRIYEKNIEILGTIERLALVKYKSPSAGNQISQPTITMSSNGDPKGLDPGVSGMQNMTGNNSNQGASSKSGMSSSMQSTSMGSVSDGAGLSDLFRIQIELLELQNNLASLKNQERTIRANFNSLLNRNPLSPVFVDTIIKSGIYSVSELAAVDSIIANNSSLSMIDYEKQSYDARKRMIKGMNYPMVGLGVNYALISKNQMSASPMNGADMLMPMVSVTLPIYRKKYNALKSETDLLKSATEKNYEATFNFLQTEFYNAFQLYQDASRRAKVYEDQLNLASRSLDILLKDFSTSAASLTEVLRLLQQTLEYKLKLEESKVDINIAIAWLQQLTTSSNNQYTF